MLVNESLHITMLLGNADWPVRLHLSWLAVSLKCVHGQCGGNGGLKMKSSLERTRASYFNSKVDFKFLLFSGEL